MVGLILVFAVAVMAALIKTVEKDGTGSPMDATRG
jgi:hypothetical protein